MPNFYLRRRRRSRKTTTAAATTTKKLDYGKKIVLHNPFTHLSPLRSLYERGETCMQEYHNCQIDSNLVNYQHCFDSSLSQASYFSLTQSKKAGRGSSENCGSGGHILTASGAPPQPQFANKLSLTSFITRERVSLIQFRDMINYFTLSSTTTKLGANLGHILAEIRESEGWGTGWGSPVRCR